MRVRRGGWLSAGDAGSAATPLRRRSFDAIAEVEPSVPALLILIFQDSLQYKGDCCSRLLLRSGLMPEREATRTPQIFHRLCRRAGVAGPGPASLDELGSDTDREAVAARIEASMPVEGRGGHA